MPHLSVVAPPEKREPQTSLEPLGQLADEMEDHAGYAVRDVPLLRVIRGGRESGSSA